VPLPPARLFGLVFGEFWFVVLTNYSNATTDGNSLSFVAAVPSQLSQLAAESFRIALSILINRPVCVCRLVRRRCSEGRLRVVSSEKVVPEEGHLDD